jgi:DNA-binding Xre family transcriptional regulator
MPIRWKLNEVMARKRMRNKDLAEYLDITENSVYRLRKADDMPRLTPQRLEGICAALQCQPGELLEWLPGDRTLRGSVLSQEALPAKTNEGAYNSVIVQHDRQELNPVSKVALQRLTQYYQPILSLAWQGYMEYGLGAVVFTDLDGGPKLAFIERQNLTDRNCLEAIDQNDPEASAVVLYYKSLDYSSPDYTLLTLTGPKSPPECFAFNYKSQTMT